MTTTGGEMVIRDAREEDRPRIAELTLAAYREFAGVMAPAAWSGLNGAVRSALDVWSGVDWIVAELDGRPVGSVVLYPAAADAYNGAAERATWPELRLLSVAPEARGQGIGRLLVEECVRRSREAGEVALGLHTSESMEVAIAMYEKMGFQRAPAFDFQPEGAELVTAYKLPLTG